MRHVIRLMAIVCFGLVALAGGPADAERRVALVIGNSAYQHTRVLPNPKNDAEAVAGLLRQIGFADAEVTLKIDLGYGTLREELRAFAGRTAGADVAIVYYAGHGIEVGGENWLVPVDARLASDRDLEWEAITLASVLNVVGDARKLKLVILDACRNNPLSDKMALRAGVTREATRGLVRIEPKGDLLVAYAAKAGTVALDGKGRHSPYAEALLKHMATPGLDVFRMFGRVSEAVLDATGKRQEPWLYGRPGGEAVALVPGAQPPPVVRPSEAETARICREVEGMSNPTTLAVLERQHKGTPAGECVAARIAQLKSVAVATAPPPKVVEPAVAAGPDLTLGRSFRDCADCPEMVVVPAGSFMMGSSADEIAAVTKQVTDQFAETYKALNRALSKEDLDSFTWSKKEGPLHRVTIAHPFAVGKYEVTYAEWEACVADSACQRQHIRGLGRLPVVDVSWHDAKEYVAWLSVKTGKTYRLLSEAEWEYAARAGTTTRYAFGSSITKGKARYGFPRTDNRPMYEPVGSFAANGFGLHDMHGNVAEWCEDNWHANYNGAPVDGSVWRGGEADRRVIRGGSWYDDNELLLRSAIRTWGKSSVRYNIIGFRVAKTL